ncbi:hypothetical protein NM688_g593 [Phlebia brevispora]|uniref:Uncharacterized protein n=1 Tax=Phlebia brevispora TaxID=194682 RepID=A0ACC1TE48_9APHY|nr:hypothetical protein NM688_g593 [Phlebia brevispora]
MAYYPSAPRDNSPWVTDKFVTLDPAEISEHEHGVGGFVAPSPQPYPTQRSLTQSGFLSPGMPYAPRSATYSAGRCSPSDDGTFINAPVEDEASSSECLGCHPPNNDGYQRTDAIIPRGRPNNLSSCTVFSCTFWEVVPDPQDPDCDGVCKADDDSPIPQVNHNKIRSVSSCSRAGDELWVQIFFYNLFPPDPTMNSMCTFCFFVTGPQAVMMSRPVSSILIFNSLTTYTLAIAFNAHVSLPSFKVASGLIPHTSSTTLRYHFSV